MILNWIKNLNIDTRPATVRRFGFILALLLLALGAWKGIQAGVWYWLAAGVGMGALSACCPRVIRWIYWPWMVVGRLFGNLVFQLILTVSFYLIVTPIGLIKTGFRRTGKQESEETYWCKRKSKTDMKRMF